MPDYRYPLASIYDQLFPSPDVPDKRTFEDVAQESGGYADEAAGGNLEQLSKLLNLHLLPEEYTGTGLTGLGRGMIGKPPVEAKPDPIFTPSFHERPGLAGVMEQKPSYGPGWQTVPGTQAFSGGPGRWREEFPLEGATPPGDPAAKAWLDYNKAKYGADYTNERTVGTPEYEAGGATSLRYSNLIDQILKMANTPERYALLEKPLEDVFAAWGELGKSAEAITAAREARAEKEQQRRENAWLAQATSGGRLGAMPSEGLSTEGLKRIQQILTGSRADERLENEQARLAESERRGRMTGPSRPAIIFRTELLLLEKGMTAEKTPAGNLVVYRNKRPVEGGEQILAATMREAERQLRAGVH